VEITQSSARPADAIASAAASPPPLRLTEQAIAQVKNVAQAQQLEGHYLTVRVAPSGCNGFGYELSMVKEARPGDTTWEQDGIKLATDPHSVQYLAGTEVDFISTLQASGFKFNNPNARSACGCGQSFGT
jgi:iron-sulfur cluster assembly accessory protein